MAEPYNPDGDDLPDLPDAEEATEEVDPWAGFHEHRLARITARQPMALDQGDPWRMANPSDRERARAVVATYAVDAALTADQIAESSEARRWEVLAARHLALRAGLLERIKGGGYAATDRGRELTNGKHRN